MGLYTVRIYVHLFLNDGVEDTVGCLPNIYFSDSLFFPPFLSSPTVSWQRSESRAPHSQERLETHYPWPPESADVGGICGSAVAILKLLGE